MDSEMIKRKWTPVFENLGVKSRYISDLLCFFSEHYYLVNSNTDLPNKIQNILGKLSNKKLEVKRSLYNPITDEIEHELENGFIISKNNKFKIDELTVDEMIFLFRIDFVRELDVEGFREHRLNEIL